MLAGQGGGGIYGVNFRPTSGEGGEEGISLWLGGGMNEMVKSEPRSLLLCDYSDAKICL